MPRSTVLGGRGMANRATTCCFGPVLPSRTVPYVYIPFVHIPFVHIPFVHIPFVHIPSICIPYVLIPSIHIECRYALWPFMSGATAPAFPPAAASEIVSVGASESAVPSDVPPSRPRPERLERELPKAPTWALHTDSRGAKRAPRRVRASRRADLGPFPMQTCFISMPKASLRRFGRLWKPSLSNHTPLRTPITHLVDGRAK